MTGVGGGVASDEYSSALRVSSTLPRAPRLLLVLAALAAPPRSVPDAATLSAGKRLIAAGAAFPPPFWFDAQAWRAILVIEFGEPEGEDRLDPMWSRARTSARAQAVLRAAKCRPGEWIEEHRPSKHPDEDVLAAWPGLWAVRRLVLMPLICETPVVKIDGEDEHVAAIALVERWSGWSVAEVLTEETGSAWFETVDVVENEGEWDGAAQADARLALSARAEVTDWRPPGLPAVPPVPPGDLDGDGVADLVLRDLASERVGVVLGDGLHRIGQTFRSDRFGQVAALPGDLDGDGFPDLVVNAPGFATAPDRIPGSVWLFPGGPGLDLTHHRRLDAPRADDPSFASWLVAPGDLDGDGRPDLLVSARSPRPELLVYFGGALEAPRGRISLPTGERQLVFLAAAGDVDHDGYADVWITEEILSLNRRTVLLHGGPRPRVERVAALDNLRPLGVVDLDGDGVAEVVGVRERRLEVVGRALLGWGLRLRLDADGCTSVAAGDFLGDGRRELALGFSSGGKGGSMDEDRRGLLRLVTPSGQGLQTLHGQKDEFSFGRRLVPAGDRDGDGHEELLVYDSGGVTLVNLADPELDEHWRARP